MKFEIGERDGVVVVTPEGHIYDDPKLDELRKEMKKMVNVGARGMVVDLGKVAGMQTRGISVLLEISISLQKVGGKLVLARITEEIKRVLLIAKLMEYFECYPSVEEAVKALKAFLKG